jgi:hypothetical protein
MVVVQGRLTTGSRVRIWRVTANLLLLPIVIARSQKSWRPLCFACNIPLSQLWTLLWICSNVDLMPFATRWAAHGNHASAVATSLRSSISHLHLLKLFSCKMEPVLIISRRQEEVSRASPVAVMRLPLVTRKPRDVRRITSLRPIDGPRASSQNKLHTNIQYNIEKAA